MDPEKRAAIRFALTAAYMHAILSRGDGEVSAQRLNVYAALAMSAADMVLDTCPLPDLD